MKRILKTALSLLPFVVAIGMIASQMQAKFDVHPLITILSALVLVPIVGMIKTVGKVDPHLHFADAAAAQFYQDYVMKKFWKSNLFLKAMFDDSKYVDAKNGKTVNIPQSGSVPTSTKNPTSFPLTAVQREDTNASYDLDFYVSAPSFVTTDEEEQVTYDKADSELGDHIAVVNQHAADDMIIKALSALPGTRLKYTTGATMAAKIAGQTGNRKAFTTADLKAASVVLNLQDMPLENRAGLIDANSMDELYDSMTGNQYAAFRDWEDPRIGRIGRLYDFDLFIRSSVAVSAAALSGGNLAVNAYGASVGATDIATNLFWHKSAIAHALGQIKYYGAKDNPFYAGDVQNASIRSGGRRRYASSLGIVGIAQGTP